MIYLPVNSSKDIAEAMDSAKREIIDVYRHKRNVAQALDFSIYLSSDGVPYISYTVKELLERD